LTFNREATERKPKISFSLRFLCVCVPAVNETGARGDGHYGALRRELLGLGGEQKLAPVATLR